MIEHERHTSETYVVIKRSDAWWIAAISGGALVALVAIVVVAALG